jgi:hypothetical protein
VLAYKEEIMVEVMQRAQNVVSLRDRLDSVSSLREAADEQLAAVMAMAPVAQSGTGVVGEAVKNQKGSAEQEEDTSGGISCTNCCLCLHIFACVRCIEVYR